MDHKIGKHTAAALQVFVQMRLRSLVQTRDVVKTITYKTKTVFVKSKTFDFFKTKTIKKG